MIDVGAVGKGYLIDRVADVLADAGLRRFTVDAGGDLVSPCESRGCAVETIGARHGDVSGTCATG